jgi:lipoprotein-anchoring transpeptidase ErfK/SrfK/LysM repeat protein
MRWSRRMGVRVLLVSVWAISLLTLVYPARAQAQGGGGGTHTVERGETLSQIARQYGLDVATLMELNGMSNANLVYVGQQLVVSGGGGREQEGVDDESWQVDPATEQRQGVGYEPPRDEASGDASPSANGSYQRAGVAWEPEAESRSPYRDVSSWEETDDEPQQYTAGRSWEPPSEPRNPFYEDWEDVHAARAGYEAGTSYEPEQKVKQAPAAAYSGEKWIEIDIGDQTLTAWQGDDVVRDFTISSGSSKYPTVTGSFRTYSRTELQDMSGGSEAAGDYYYQPDVPWVQYFFEGYAIHGAYWHNSFGTPIGHGCINMRVEESRWLYDWTGVSGIRVEVHQ